MFHTRDWVSETMEMGYLQWYVSFCCCHHHFESLNNVPDTLCTLEQLGCYRYSFFYQSKLG